MPAGDENDVKLFQTIGLSEQKAKETLKNVNVTKNLKLAIDEVSRLIAARFYNTESQIFELNLKCLNYILINKLNLKKIIRK